jgi:hypothetical protein
VLNAGGDAFHIDNAVREARVTRCHVHGATGNGFYIGENCTDSRFTDCTAATITGYGWQILGAELRFSLVNCDFQQNGLHGYDLEVPSRTPGPSTAVRTAHSSAWLVYVAGLP